MTVKELKETLSQFDDDDRLFIHANTDMMGGVWCSIDIDGSYKDEDGDVIIEAEEMNW